MDTAASANGTVNSGSGASALPGQEWPNKRQKMASTSFLKNNEVRRSANLELVKNAKLRSLFRLVHRCEWALWQDMAAI